MRFLLAMALILASASAAAVDYSVGIGPSGLNLYRIASAEIMLVGSHFATPVVEANPLTPVAAFMNTPHNFVYVLYEHLGSSDGNAYILGLRVTATGLVEQWVFPQVLNMNPEANSLVKLTTGRNYAVVTWTNDFSSPYTGWIINEFGQLVASN